MTRGENRTNHVGLVSRLGWRYSRQDSCCQATWRQTSDRQSTAVSPVRPFANRHLTVPFCPLEPFHHNLLWYCHVNNSIYFAGNPIIFIAGLGLSSRAAMLPQLVTRPLLESSIENSKPLPRSYFENMMKNRETRINLGWKRELLVLKIRKACSLIWNFNRRLLRSYRLITS